jgi:hypothetical protein
MFHNLCGRTASILALSLATILGFVGLTLGASNYLSCNTAVGVWLAVVGTAVMCNSLTAISHLETQTCPKPDGDTRYSALTLALILFGICCWGLATISQADSTCPADVTQYADFAVVVAGLTSFVVIAMSLQTIWPDLRKKADGWGKV